MFPVLQYDNEAFSLKLYQNDANQAFEERSY